MTDHIDIGRFGEVDTSGQVELMLTYLDLFETLPGMAELRAESCSGAGPLDGLRVVDIGCGTGTAVAEMAAAGAEVTGVDVSASFLTIADERHPELDFRLGSAEDLPVDSGTIALARAERVFMHIADPTPAIAAIRRVLAPGGRINLMDFDADMWAVDADDEDLTSRLMLGFKDTLTNPLIGRQYRRLLLDAGFENVTVGLRPLIFDDFETIEGILGGVAMVAVLGERVTQAESETWLDDMRRRSQRGRMFLLAPIFTAAATAAAG